MSADFATSIAWHGKAWHFSHWGSREEYKSYWLFSPGSSKLKLDTQDMLVQVTAVSWSETYSDLFVVAFGSFDFQKQAAGMVTRFSRKNPAHSEFAFMLRSGRSPSLAFCHLLLTQTFLTLSLQKQLLYTK